MIVPIIVGAIVGYVLFHEDEKPKPKPTPLEPEIPKLKVEPEIPKIIEPKKEEQKNESTNEPT